MALLRSVEIPLGTRMPDFNLKDPDGRSFQGEQLFGDKGLLVVFTCNHCPYANAVWPRLIKLSRLADNLGINTVAINPNINPNYPDDAPPKMKEKIEELGLPFPYLADETQATAKAFQAQCTPDVYLFDQRKDLVYHGRIDDNWQDETQVTKQDLREALEQLGSGAPIQSPQHPSMGCSIKWL